MYQIRDNKTRKIIARFLTKKDAESFLRLKKREDEERFEMVKAGEKDKKDEK